MSTATSETEACDEIITDDLIITIYSSTEETTQQLELTEGTGVIMGGANLTSPPNEHLEPTIIVRQVVLDEDYPNREQEEDEEVPNDYLELLNKKLKVLDDKWEQQKAALNAMMEQQKAMNAIFNTKWEILTDQENILKTKFKNKLVKRSAAQHSTTADRGSSSSQIQLQDLSPNPIKRCRRQSGIIPATKN